MLITDLYVFSFSLPKARDAVAIVRAPVRGSLPSDQRAPSSEIYDAFNRALVTNRSRFLRSRPSAFDSRKLLSLIPRGLSLPARTRGYDEPSAIQWSSYMTPGDDTLNLI